LVPEVLVSGDRYALTRPRPSYDEMLAAERLPNWL
jgi:diaminopimelate decarboxylase